ncbi:MAG TPA: tetratricopeptide repeat protein, partial [Spirochaetia bacterium]|nr:tetratricopeptide repeat protein [Spirochaetia bacterium]
MNTQKSILEQAFKEYENGNIEDTILLLADAELKDDEYLDAAYLLGLCYLQLKDYDNALVYLEQLITADITPEKSRQCRLLLAYIYTITGRIKLADYELKKLAAQKDITAELLEAYAAYKQKDFSKALELYQKILNQNPSQATALNDFGYILAETTQEFSRALSLCMNALKLQPQNPYYLDSVAWIYYKMGKVSDALPYIQKAFSLMPHNNELKTHKEIIEKAAL